VRSVNVALEGLGWLLIAVGVLTSIRDWFW
jgi:hypothetical protein